MAKRKSEKGIVLQTGESQLANGRYRYRYYDDNGRAHDIYSWRLRPEDPTPEGKKPGKSLRELEKEIQKGMEDGLRMWDASTLTVAKLVNEYIDSQRPYWKPNTLSNNLSQKKHIDTSGIGKKKVNRVTADDVEKFYLVLIDGGMKASSVSAVDKLLNSGFRQAVKKKIVSSNPVSGCLGAVKKKVGYQSEQRHALEQGELSVLLEYIAENSLDKYIPCYILAWTGLRFGELAGLCWCDIDFDAEIVHVRRTLEYTTIDGGKQYYFNTPKTAAGTRDIPMLKDVKKFLLQIRAETKVVQMVPADKVTVDNTIFRSSTGKPMNNVVYGSFLKCIVQRYNRDHEDQLPEVSPHIFRHSFVCWLVENFSCGENASLLDNLKYIQHILGHSDAGTTLNTYAELRKDKLKEKHELLKQRAMNS